MYKFLDKHWKPLTFVTIVIFLLSSGLLAYNQLTTGSFLERDIDLTGGKQISIVLESAPDIAAIRDAIPEANIQVVSGLQTTLLVEVEAEADEDDILARLSAIGVSGESSIKTVGPLLGEIFFQQAQIAIIIAFILMGIVIFILFRSLVPSVAVLLAALTDITFALAVLHLIGAELSLAVLAGALMLLGYSVDTDIVLTTELLKSKGKEIPDRVRAAVRTGMTITLTALAAILAMYFVSGSDVVQQIALVLIIGLIIDMPSTWLTNAGILRWWVQRKERKESQ